MDLPGRVVKTFDRMVLSLGRRLTRRSRVKELEGLPAMPLVAEPLPEERRPTGLSRAKSVAAGFVLVAVASTGGAFVGHEWGQGEEVEASPQAMAQAPADPGGLVGLAENVCEARAEAARAELVRNEAGPDPDGGLSTMMVGMSELEECRAELELESAELKAQEVRDQFED